MRDDLQDVFIVGSKGFGSYGGYETFVDKLTEQHQENEEIMYHIACKANGQGCMEENQLQGVKVIDNNQFIYHKARGFKVKTPQIGAAQAIYYDIKALNECCEFIQKNKIEKPIVYILACRIGLWAKHFQKKIHRLGGKVYLNPDGHEWKRAKWSLLIRKYWKISERMMVKNSDLVICDSKNIEKYIQREYAKYKPKTTYIAYGAETQKSNLGDENSQYTSWLKEKEITPNGYYLVVGRLVPENNFETILREFMKTDIKKDLVIICTENDDLLEKLEEKLSFKADKRIKFVGTVYNQELLKKIRESAYGYLHGHEVGGTNPSLLEALSSTDLNLLLDVGFNKEVAEDSALYWSKERGSLSMLINNVDTIHEQKRVYLSKKAKERIEKAYSWEYIADQYKKVLT